ncbi:MAG: ABC transporter permease [Vampirovibrionales bacterium]|nr:ABC transporter permease [Vampirovibrionales bacterium]
MTTPPIWSVQRWASVWERMAGFATSLTWPGIESIVRKELIQLFRDPFLVTFIVLLPIVQLLVTGLAIAKDLQHIPLAICNLDHRNASIELIKTFQASQVFNVTERSYLPSDSAVQRALRQGKFRAGIVIPPDFSERLLNPSGGAASVRILIDGANATIAKSMRANAMAVVESFQRQQTLGGRSVSGLAGSSASNLMALPRVVSSATVLYNPELQTAYFLVPGILAIIMHMMTILFTSFAIVRERESGTLEQLMVTPIRVSDLMVGKILPYAMIGFLDMVLTLLVMVWFFDIGISGNFLFLLATSSIFIITSLAIGLLISTTCRSQVQAVQVTLALLLPSLMISGFVFPIEPIPWFIKIISYSLPITYYLEIIRGVVIKGSGLGELWLPTLILSVLAGLLLTTSVLRFKKRVA